MKKLLIVLLFITSIGWSQNVSVINKKELVELKGKGLYYPTLNYDGSKVLLTKNNYQGLYLYDVASKEMKVVSEQPGSGYRPIFSEDGSKILFKADEFEGIKRYSSLIEYDINTAKSTVLINKERFMNFYKSPESNSLVVKTAYVTRSFNMKEMKSIENSSIPNFAMMENDIVKIYKNNEVIEYQPFGPGNYIWVSTSADNKLLFTYAGKGTFVNDFNTNTLYEIGKANAAVFADNGNYVVYMNDKDDGEKVYASDILVSSFDGKVTYNLTNTVDDIEMYPNVSGNSKKVAYATTDGKVFILEVSFE